MMKLHATYEGREMAQEPVFGYGQGDDERALPEPEAHGGSGATGIFGVTAPAKTSEPAQGTGAVENRVAPPVVHSVVFKKDSSRVEETDQLMNLLRTPPRAEVPPPPVASSSAGGFTQLLRAINQEQAKEPAQPAETSTAPVPPRNTEPVAPPSEARTMMMPRVTSFEPPAPTPHRPQAPPPLLADPVLNEPERAQPLAPAGSFTQLFQSVTAPPQELAHTEEPPAAPVPGAFTQMFRTLQAAPVNAATEPVSGATSLPEVPASNPSGSFTRMLSTPVLPVEVVSVEPPPPAPSPGPGSFTQVFRALDRAPTNRYDATPAPPLSPVAPATIPVPGSFTQMFSTPAAPPLEAAKVEPPPVPAPAGPGSFTQMFQTVTAPPGEPASSATMAAGPGSFTRMFRALDSAPAPAAPPASAVGASPPFGIYPPPSEPAKAAPVFFPVETVQSPIVPAPKAPVASSGGLTQLLRALDQPVQEAPRPSAAPAFTPVPPGQQPGSFTAVYGTLNANPASQPVSPPASRGTAPHEPYSAQPFLPPQAPAMPMPGAMPPATALPQAGPSEFTRIMNASQMREAAMREGAAEAPAAPAATPPAPAPWAMPAMPAAPKAPEIPKPKLPEAPKPPAAGGLQQYVPLLLILVIFLLLAILVAVIFLMKK